MTAQTLLNTIGNTPIIKLTTFDTGPCDLYLKLESMNPGGSVKDRIALHMIETAEKEGKLKPGGTIVEATAGNTGVALAMVAIERNYKMKIVMPDKMSLEKIDHLKAFGAEIIMTRSDVKKGHPEYYQDLAATIASKTPNSFYISQFSNPANAEAHALYTGPEIWQQMEGKLDAFVVGVGTGGTITGAGKYLKQQNPDIDIILADPKGSILKHYIDTGELRTDAGSWLVEGIGEDYIPSICDLSHVDAAYTVSDQEAFRTVRNLLKQTGIFAGTSSGVLLKSALQYCKEQTTPKRVLTLICDGGAKYLSKAYNDAWLKEKGLDIS